MSKEELSPILQESVIRISESQGKGNLTGHQQTVQQPTELDRKHKNMYGYVAIGASLLTFINYLMINERACQIYFSNGVQNYQSIQGFHLLAIIVGLVLFLMSYFNFAAALSEFKVLFYAAALLIFICSGSLIYNSVAIFSAPCVSVYNHGIGSLVSGSGIVTNNNNVFSAGDGIGIVVFLFDLIASGCMFVAGRRFYLSS